jgi:hypothetical protein
MKPSILHATRAEKGLGGRSAKPWQHMPLEDPPALGGPLDPLAPRALWRLIQIGEMAGLIGATGQAKLLAAFRPTEARSAGPLAEIGQFRCGLTDLYVLVTLFAASPRPVPIPLLARETLAEASGLRESLDHLDAAGLLETESMPTAEIGLRLSEAGTRLAVLLIYRVLKSIV